MSWLFLFLIFFKLNLKLICAFEPNHLPINFVNQNSNDDIIYSRYVNSKQIQRIHETYEIEKSEDSNYYMNVYNQSEFAMPKSSNQQVKWINLNELIDLIVYLNQQRLNSQAINLDAFIIDTRNSNEYNGWKSFRSLEMNTNLTGLMPLYDLKNGHLIYAQNLDADWLHLFDSQPLNELIIDRFNLNLLNSTLKSEINPIILYDTNKLRLEKVKNYLYKNFQTNKIYLCRLTDAEINSFITYKLNQTNQISEANSPVAIASNLFFQEPFYDMLLSSEVLFSIMRPFNQSYVINVNPLAEYKLFDVSQGGPDKHYERSHIPTALHLNTFDLEDIYFVRKNRTELAKLFLSYGIQPNNSEMIILYGNPDPMASFRVALIMKYMGIRDIHVLNGGFRSWIIKNYPTESYANKKVPIKNDIEKNIKLYEEQSFLSQSPINYIVDYNYVNDLVNNYELYSKNYALVDVRSLSEYVGEKSGYEGLMAKGRIPNSLWGKGGSSADQLEDYRNPDLTMRSGLDILKMWDDLGIDYKTKHLIFYCGNGWRSSEVLFYAELMGLYKISLYDRGWLEWSSVPNNTIQTGANGPYKSTTVVTQTVTNFTTTQTTTTTTTTTKIINQQVAVSNEKPTETTKPPVSIQQTMRPSLRPTTNSSDLNFKNQFDFVPKNSALGLSFFAYNCLIFIIINIIYII